MAWKLAVVALLTAVLGGATYVVPEWQQAIVTQFGQPIRTVREPGLYWKLPLVHTVTLFDRRVLATDTGGAEYLTLDKKRLLIDHISRWRVEDPLEFFRTVQNEVGAMARLDDIITARLRQEVAKETFKEIIREKRDEIMDTVTREARALAAPFGIHVVDVRVKRADLPMEVQASVFARMQPEFIELAGLLGLGVGDESKIDVRKIKLG